MRIFASPLRHFFNRPPKMRNGSQEMTPISSDNILKCADALNLDNDQHCFNTDNFPPPLGKLTSVSSWTFPRQVASALLWRAPKEAPSGLEDQQSSEISFHHNHQASSTYLWLAIIAALTFFQCVLSSTRFVEMVAASLSSL